MKRFFLCGTNERALSSSWLTSRLDGFVVWVELDACVRGLTVRVTYTVTEQSQSYGGRLVLL